MKFKSNVRMYDFSDPAVMLILQVVQHTAPKGYEPTVTSANDSKHEPNSLHYKNRAFDIRVKDYPGFSLWRFEKTKGVIFEWIRRMRKFLPESDYDIIFGDAMHKNHIHIEYDPIHHYQRI